MTRSQFLLLTGIILLSLQCRKNDGLLPECQDCNLTCIAEGDQDVFSNTCRNNYTCTFKWQENAQLDYSANTAAQINPGDKLVFSVRIETDGHEGIADDEFTDLVYFEIDPSMDSFSVESGELNLINARYRQACYCGDTGFKIPEGCIQGQRIDADHWQIQANLTIEYASWTKALKIDAVFVE
jgi:hypothetical protein